MCPKNEKTFRAQSFFFGRIFRARRHYEDLPKRFRFYEGSPYNFLHKLRHIFIIHLVVVDEMHLIFHSKIVNFRPK